MSQTTRSCAPLAICAAMCVALAFLTGACGSDNPRQSSASVSSTAAAPTTSTAPPASVAAPTSAAVPGTAATAAAPTSTVPGREVKFEYTAVDQPVTPIAAQRCTTDGQACLLPLSDLPARFSGDLVGDVVVQSSISTRGDRLSSVAQLVFSGTLGQCGTGTVAIVLAGTFRPDGTTARDGLYHWWIVDGSGTGELVGATGAGDGTEGLGPLSGTIVCG